MASIQRSGKRQFWYGSFTDACGKRHLQSTNTTDKAEAQRICKEWEERAQKGERPPRIRKNNEFLFQIGRTQNYTRKSVFPKDFSEQEWVDGFAQLCHLHAEDSVRFRIGDYIIYVMRAMEKESHKLKKAAWKRGLNKFINRPHIQKLDPNKCAQVAQLIPPGLRRDGLTWEHYKIIATLKNEQLITKWLEQADKDQPSVQQLREQIAAQIEALTRKRPLA